MKESKCPIDSSSSNDKQVKNQQNKSSNFLSDIRRYLEVPPNDKSSKDNVELGLEIEINESLKHVLATPTPHSGSDDLLDVTIIRPSDSDVTHETTVALNKEEVRDFISLVEQHHKNKLKNSVKHKKPRKRSKSSDQPLQITRRTSSKGSQESKEVKVHKEPSPTCFSKDTKIAKELKDYQHFSKESKENGSKTSYQKYSLSKSRHVPTRESHQNPLVDATVNTVEKETKNVEVQNRIQTSRTEKPGTPCVCQHCGIMGVLVQSQKSSPHPQSYPVLDDRSNREDRKFRQRKERSFNYNDLGKLPEHSSNKQIDQMELLKEINTRIKNLERRISIQEETAVPREYLKHVLHKLLTQYRLPVREAETDQKVKSAATQYVSETREPKFNCEHRKDGKPKSYQIQTILTDNPFTTDENIQTNHGQNQCKEDLNRCNQIQTHIENESKQNQPQHTSTPDKITSKQSIKLNEQTSKSTKDLFWFWGEEVVKPGCDLKNKILSLLEDKMSKRTIPFKKREDNQNMEVTDPCMSNTFPEKLPKMDEPEIKVERYDKLLFLGEMDEMQPCNIEECVFRNKPQTPLNLPQNNSNVNKTPAATKPGSPNSTSQDVTASLDAKRPHNDKVIKNDVKSVVPPRGAYTFNPRRTVDDSTFRRNIEAQKGRTREMIRMTPTIHEHFVNSFATCSAATESNATMEYVMQKLKNQGFGINNNCFRQTSNMRPDSYFRPENIFRPETNFSQEPSYRENIKPETSFRQDNALRPMNAAKAGNNFRQENVVRPQNSAGQDQQSSIDDSFLANHYQQITNSMIKNNIKSQNFRVKKVEEIEEVGVPVHVKYISPKITHWSEESTASEDKYMKYNNMVAHQGEKRGPVPLETKESLIYKLEFLKNLAKHKSADQSKVLNKIWNQARKTAKSKNDAVFIKIPFKSINTVEPRNNVIEMQLTLEQLETVVKSVKEDSRSSTKIWAYKSTSDIDIGQRRHEEIKKANLDLLNKRKLLSAKTNRSKDKK